MRPFKPSDLARILEIESRAFGDDAYPRQLFEEFFENYPAGFQVVTVKRQVAGYILGFASGGSGTIVSLAVDPDFQKRGLGIQLCRFLLSQFERQGVTVCWLQVRAGNQPAIALYQSVGFQTMRTLQHYYSDGGEALLMRRSFK
ncbi:MAG: ribosomal protein S18-alanine N-acetyltransferase [Acidobacteriota bacterium]